MSYCLHLQFPIATLNYTNISPNDFKHLEGGDSDFLFITPKTFSTVPYTHNCASNMIGDTILANGRSEFPGWKYSVVSLKKAMVLKSEEVSLPPGSTSY